MYKVLKVLTGTGNMRPVHISKWFFVTIFGEID